MELTSTLGKVIGKVLLKTGLKRLYIRGKRWYYHNIRGEKTPVEKLQESARRIEQLEKRNRTKDIQLESKEERIEEREEELSEVKRDLSLKDRLIESLEIEGISRQELYRKNLDDPAPFLIFRLGGQIPEDSEGNGWVRNKLQDRFDAETVGSSYVIPPDQFPDELTLGKMTLSEWMEAEIDEEDKQANFVYVAWVDLAKGELYWQRNYESRSPMLDLEDQFEMESYMGKGFYEFDEVKDALELVKKGDIGFFAAKFVTDEEIREIHENQPSIEEDLGRASLKELAVAVDIGDIHDALANYVADPTNVAQGVKEEAEIWYEELYSSAEAPA